MLRSRRSSLEEDSRLFSSSCDLGDLENWCILGVLCSGLCNSTHSPGADLDKWVNSASVAFRNESAKCNQFYFWSECFFSLTDDIWLFASVFIRPYIFYSFVANMDVCRKCYDSQVNIWKYVSLLQWKWSWKWSVMKSKSNISSIESFCHWFTRKLQRALI